MCIFGGSTPPTPPPLPPAPPPPAPPKPTPEPNIIKDVNPMVKRKKKDLGDKLKNPYSQGTGSLKIKLNPKLNTGANQTTGGVN